MGLIGYSKPNLKYLVCDKYYKENKARKWVREYWRGRVF